MIFFIVFSSLYIIFLLWARDMWDRIPLVKVGAVSKYKTFSVILPVRNESANILQILTDLEHQDYPNECFEVVVVDDNSEDQTFELARDFFATSQLQYRIIRLSEFDRQGKKYAITEGVSSSSMECVLTTDGDCRVQPEWISAYNQAYQASSASMITGPVKMDYHNFFTKLQSGEFSGLIMIGAASLQSGNPSMCNGANLSYKREVFNQVNGYAGNENIPSGDDEFLLQKVHKAHKDSVFFLKSEKAVVSTNAKPSFRSLVNQRIRWSSKWRFHKSFFIRFSALFLFLNYVALFAALVESILSGTFVLFLSIFLIRWIVLWIFSRPVTQFLGISNVLGVTLVIEIIYPFFVTFLGIASTFGKYSWKGRYYS